MAATHGVTYTARHNPMNAPSSSNPSTLLGM